MDPSIAERVGGLLDESVRSVEPLTGGASYRSFRVQLWSGRTCHARMRSDAEPDDVGLSRIGLATEAALLRRAVAAGVPVPHVLASSDEPQMLVTEWLEGETLGGRIARKPEFAPARTSFAQQCGVALARLHAVSVDGLDLPTTSPVDFIDETHVRYQRTGVVRPMLDGVARHLIQTAPEPVPPRLVHGDFRNGNLMVHRRRGVVGVLDWELARLGDPMQDLGYLMLNSWRFGVPEKLVGGCGDRADLFSAYEAEAGVEIDESRVAWWQAAGSYWWGVTCLVQASRFDPNRSDTVEFAAIGPRVSEAEVDCANLLLANAPAAADPMIDSGNTRAGVAAALALSLGENAGDYRQRVLTGMAGVVERDLRFGPACRRREQDRIGSVLDISGSLTDLRNALASLLWAGERSITEPEVTEHLVRTVLDQLRIDQPGYAAPPLTD
ncbi:MAG: phosphotransferase family protein [Acidimicrobiales bacterium]